MVLVGKIQRFTETKANVQVSQKIIAWMQDRENGKYTWVKTYAVSIFQRLNGLLKKLSTFIFLTLT